MVLKYTPKHILVMMQKSPLNKDFVGFCLRFDPLNSFALISLSLKNLSKFDKTTPFFFLSGILDP